MKIILHVLVVFLGLIIFLISIPSHELAAFLPFWTRIAAQKYYIFNLAAVLNFFYLPISWSRHHRGKPTEIWMLFHVLFSSLMLFFISNLWVHIESTPLNSIRDLEDAVFWIKILGCVYLAEQLGFAFFGTRIRVKQPPPETAGNNE
jgi:hypothetical protein